MTVTVKPTIAAGCDPRMMPARRHVREVRGRLLHLIDLENQLGGDISTERVRGFVRAYLDAHLIGPQDRVVVAAGASSAPWWAFEVPASWHRIFVGSEADAADLALLEHAAEEQWSSASGVVIASGDHIFTNLAVAVELAGGLALQVLGSGLASATLTQACHGKVRLRPWWDRQYCRSQLELAA